MKALKICIPIAVIVSLITALVVGIFAFSELDIYD